MRKQLLNYINGEWVGAATQRTITSLNPANGEVVGEAPSASAAETEQAIDAARQAFDSGRWRDSTGAQRAGILLKLGALVRENADVLATLITQENGRPLKSTRGEVLRSAEIFEYFAAQARTLGGRTNLTEPDLMSIVSYEPVGVCGLIIPWNFPVDLAVRKLAAALAAGCTVVLKPSSLTPIVTLEMAKLIASVPELPPGVFNVVAGSGSEVGDTLVRSGKVNKISFTGETETGKSILRAAAGTMKRVSLECGGKSPNIIFDDAPWEAAVQGALWGTFHNTGQSCTAKSRVVVQRSIHDRLVAELAERVPQIRVGNGMNAASEIGPLASHDQLEKVLTFIDEGTQEGARRVAGGERLRGSEYDNGYFLQPAIFDQVTSSMSLAQHEIFGPVLSILTFDTEEEAIEIANATSFGLSSSLWTRDIQRAFRVARAVRAGEVVINSIGARLVEAPFGGYGESGIGRELGSEGLREYQEVKHICVPLH